MAQYETSEKRSKRNSGGGFLALIIILLIAGIIGYIYYAAVKAPLDLDDPRKLAASAPMAAEERFEFSPDGTVRVTMDKTDIWYMIVSLAGPDFLDLVNDEISSYGLTVTGCAIHMDEDGLRLDLELSFKGTRLVVKAPCDLQITGRRISFSPTGVYLGVIPLPVKGLLSAVDLEYALPLPVIAEVTDSHFEKDALILTGSVEQDIPSLLPPEKKLRQITVFNETYLSLAESLLARDGLDAIMADLTEDPGAVEALYRDLFTLVEADVAENYLTQRLGLTQRFLPGLDFAAIAADQAALEQQLAEQATVLNLFLTCAVNDFNEKHFILSNGQFLKNWVSFQATQYGESCAPLFEILDPETFFLVLVDAADGNIRKTSSFYKLADQNLQFTQPVDFNKTYILGCVFRNVTGAPFLMYESEVHTGGTYYVEVKYIPLTQEEAAALQVPGMFGVYIG